MGGKAAAHAADAANAADAEPAPADSEQSLILCPESWSEQDPLVLAYMLKMFQRIKQNTLKLPMSIVVCFSAIAWLTVYGRGIEVQLETVVPAHAFALLALWTYMQRRLQAHSSGETEARAHEYVCVCLFVCVCVCV
jgi:hypothetical protein